MSLKRPTWSPGRLVTLEHTSRVLADNPLGDPGHIWVTDITATQFTVRCANDPGDSLGFEWRAQLTIGP